MGQSCHSLGGGGGSRVDAAASDSTTTPSAKNRCAAHVSTPEAHCTQHILTLPQ